MTDEIDDLFAKRKPKPITKKPEKIASSVIINNDDESIQDLRGNKIKARPLTADGLPIYQLWELNISTTGGDSPDCPFDCECCF